MKANKQIPTEYLINKIHDGLNSNTEIFMNLTLEETTPLAVCKYIRENVDVLTLFQYGYNFNALVNNTDFFSGHIYSDNGDMYWGTIQQRTDSIDNCQIYKYFSSGGADSVAPFNTGDKYKNIIVDSLANTNKGLTYDSTWEDIARVINECFPDQLNLLSKWGVSEVYQIPQWWDEPITWYSEDFDITNFSTLQRTVDYNTTAGVNDERYGMRRCYLVTDQATISILGSGGVDVSGYSGMARIMIQVGGTKPWSSSDSTSRGWVRIKSLVLYA